MEATLKALDLLYLSALRFIIGDPYRTDHCMLYEKVGWSSLSVRIETHWLLFIYKALFGQMPEYITSMLTVKDTRYNVTLFFFHLRLRDFTDLG